MAPNKQLAVGQSLSASFMSVVNTSHSSLDKVLHNLGSRPSAASTERSSEESGSSCASSLLLEKCCDVSCSEVSSASSKSSSTSSLAIPAAPTQSRRSKHEGSSYTLGALSALEVVENLLVRYGRASHMGCRDHSYQVFLNEQQDGALYYKVLDGTAVVSGDPLCPISHYPTLLAEFRRFCKRRHLGVAIVAGSQDLAAVAQKQKWISIRFGTEKVLNPLTNPLLHGSRGKRTVSKCRQLLKSGMSVDPYVPSFQYDADVESDLVRIYEDWCRVRNASGNEQTHITSFDILALPRLMLFICARDPQGRMNGFVALRRLGSGYHCDPFIASADAPRGTVDFLLYSTMAFCYDAQIDYLSLGFEPLPELGEIAGMSKTMASVTRRIHRRVYGDLPLEGKHTFNQRWCPDEEKDGGLHIIFLQQPGPRSMLATMHFANIRLRGVVRRSFASEKTENELLEGEGASIEK